MTTQALAVLPGPLPDVPRQGSRHLRRRPGGRRRGLVDGSLEHGELRLALLALTLDVVGGGGHPPSRGLASTQRRPNPRRAAAAGSPTARAGMILSD